MEHKIGEIFEDRGYWYQCLESSSCRCDYCDYGELGDCNKIACASGERSDDKEVYFKKLEKIGEPYLVHDHSRNKDVIVQNYKLHSQCACYNGNEEMLLFSYNGHEGTVTIKTNEPIYKKIKKDMEEKYNKLNKATGKLTLKPFDLEAAKAGKPVCTRDGRKARIICFDRDWDMHIVALVADPLGETVHYYLTNGKVDFDKQNDEDLMMLSEKKEGWVNVYKSYNVGKTIPCMASIYPTKEEAKKSSVVGFDYVDTVKIEWEE